MFSARGCPPVRRGPPVGACAGRVREEHHSTARQHQLRPPVPLGVRTQSVLVSHQGITSPWVSGPSLYSYLTKVLRPPGCQDPVCTRISPRYYVPLGVRTQSVLVSHQGITSPWVSGPSLYSYLTKVLRPPGRQDPVCTRISPRYYVPLGVRTQSVLVSHQGITSPWASGPSLYSYLTKVLRPPGRQDPVCTRISPRYYVPLGVRTQSVLVSHQGITSPWASGPSLYSYLTKVLRPPGRQDPVCTRISPRYYVPLGVRTQSVLVSHQGITSPWASGPSLYSYLTKVLRPPGRQDPVCTRISPRYYVPLGVRTQSVLLSHQGITSPWASGPSLYSYLTKVLRPPGRQDPVCTRISPRYYVPLSVRTQSVLVSHQGITSPWASGPSLYSYLTKVLRPPECQDPVCTRISPRYYVPLGVRTQSVLVSHQGITSPWVSGPSLYSYLTKVLRPPECQDPVCTRISPRYYVPLSVRTQSVLVSHQGITSPWASGPSLYSYLTKVLRPPECQDPVCTRISPRYYIPLGVRTQSVLVSHQGITSPWASGPSLYSYLTKVLRLPGRQDPVCTRISPRYYVPLGVRTQSVLVSHQGITSPWASGPSLYSYLTKVLRPPGRQDPVCTRISPRYYVPLGVRTQSVLVSHQGITSPWVSGPSLYSYLTKVLRPPGRQDPVCTRISPRYYVPLGVRTQSVLVSHQGIREH